MWNADNVSQKEFRQLTKTIVFPFFSTNYLDECPLSYAFTTDSTQMTPVFKPLIGKSNRTRNGIEVELTLMRQQPLRLDKFFFAAINPSNTFLSSTPITIDIQPICNSNLLKINE